MSTVEPKCPIFPILGIKNFFLSVTRTDNFSYFKYLPSDLMRSAIWWHSYNLKNVKNAHGGVEKCFSFHLTSSFPSRDIQIFVFRSSPLFLLVSHCFRGWSNINLIVFDIINCLNKNLITHFSWYLGKEEVLHWNFARW